MRPRAASPPGRRLARILPALLVVALASCSIAPALAQTSQQTSPAPFHAYAPPVAPVLTHASGAETQIASGYAFDRVKHRRHVYVSANVTTGADVSGFSQLIFQWGEDPSTCGGLIGFVRYNSLLFGVNCEGLTGSNTFVSAVDAMSDSTDYLLEFYYDSSERVAKVWIDGFPAVDAVVGSAGYNWNDGAVSVGALHDGAYPWPGTIHEVAFYEWSDAHGFGPTCAPVFKHVAGAQNQVRQNYAFDEANKYVYVSARVTTPASFTSYNVITLWGTASHCGGGLMAFLGNGRQAFGTQCNSGSIAPTYDEDALAANTEYLLEWMYDKSAGELKMWRDGVLRVSIATSGYSYVDGHISVGYGYHDGTGEAFGGTVHEISVYECRRGGSVFADRTALKAEVDACLDAEPTGARCGMEAWDVSSVTSMHFMFSGAAAFNQPIGGWDVSSVTNMGALFENAAAFNQPIGGWDMSSVTSMSYMFSGAAAFNHPIGGWVVSSVTQMSYMFRNAAAFNQPIGGWDVSSVTVMSNMFNGAAAFDQPIGGWFVSSVTSMSEMFYGAAAFDQPIGDWDVSSVTNMYRILTQARAFDQPIGGWDVSSVTNMGSVFSGAAAFNQPIEGWNVSSVTQMSFMFRDAAAFNQPIGGWDVSSVTSMSYMFSGAAAFDQPIGGWNVSSVTIVDWMFAGAAAFNQPIGDWDVSSVTIMNHMFYSAAAFNQPIGGWNVSSVTNMGSVFSGAAAFDKPIGDWDVSSATNMAYMFSGAAAFNQPIGGWNVSSVTNVALMFNRAAAFNQPIGGWNVSSATIMTNMFQEAFAWLGTYVNCGFDASVAGVCTYDTYPTSAAALDGPPAAWHARHCVIAAPIDGSLGSCETTLARSSHCVPACDAPEAMAQPARCDAHARLKKAPACLCTCEEKAARFGFVVPKKKK